MFTFHRDRELGIISKLAWRWPISPPPMTALMMHVSLDSKRIYTGVVHRGAPPTQWIPQIVDEAKQATGQNLKTTQTHPNDLSWVKSHPHLIFMDSLEIQVEKL